MFGPPGRAYVYLVYGMHDCLNLVTEPDGEPAALLVRAIEPIEGMELMRADRISRSVTRRRGLSGQRATAAADRIAGLPRARLASGPGSVTAAFGIDTGWTGMDLCDPTSPLHLERSDDDDRVPMVDTTPRIGIDYAGDPWTLRPWRFVERGHKSVSVPVLSRAAGR